MPIGGELLLVRRAIAPRGLALPGGFIELGESWQDAVAREVREETGVIVDADQITEFAVRSAPDGTVLMFGLCAPPAADGIPNTDVETPEETDEVLLCADYDLHTMSEQVVFDLHAEVIRLYADRRFTGR